MKKAALLLAVVALAASALAQKSEKDSQVQPLGTDVCQSTFTSGNGVTYMTFCTTQNGNVSKFESPSGRSQLFHGGEGYGFCDQTNGNVGYYDWGTYGDSGWQNATITQPNGPNTFPLTINRTTADGVWTVKQVFGRNTTTPAVKITMTLKNNSAVTRQIQLERFADIDADSETVNRFDVDRFGAWGYNDYNGHGLMMRTNTGNVLGAAAVYAPTTMDPCNFGNSKVRPFEGDGAILYDWPFTGIAPQKSITAVMEYRAF